MEINQGQTCIFSRLQQCQRVVKEYNTDRIEEERTPFVETMKTYIYEPNNDQLDQENNTIEECKEQQQLEDKEGQNVHDTISSSTPSTTFPWSLLPPNTLLNMGSI